MLQPVTLGHCNAKADKVSSNQDSSAETCAPGSGNVAKEREITAAETGDRSRDFGTRSQIEISGQMNEKKSEDHRKQSPCPKACSLRPPPPPLLFLHYYCDGRWVPAMPEFGTRGVPTTNDVVPCPLSVMSQNWHPGRHNLSRHSNYSKETNMSC